MLAFSRRKLERTKGEVQVLCIFGGTSVGVVLATASTPVTLAWRMTSRRNIATLSGQSIRRLCDIGHQFILTNPYLIAADKNNADRIWIMRAWRGGAFWRHQFAYMFGYLWVLNMIKKYNEINISGGPISTLAFELRAIFLLPNLEVWILTVGIYTHCKFIIEEKTKVMLIFAGKTVGWRNIWFVLSVTVNSAYTISDKTQFYLNYFMKIHMLLKKTKTFT